MAINSAIGQIQIQAKKEKITPISIQVKTLVGYGVYTFIALRSLTNEVKTLS